MLHCSGWLPWSLRCGEGSGWVRYRPLLRTADPRATLAALFAVRAPVYALADLKVQARPDYSIEEMADKVLGALQSRPDVLETVK